MRGRKEALAGRSVEEQAELRQRLLAVDKDLLELLSEM
jgi:metallo-beta-lactamase family protein